MARPSLPVTRNREEAKVGLPEDGSIQPGGGHAHAIWNRDVEELAGEGAGRFSLFDRLQKLWFPPKSWVRSMSRDAAIPTPLAKQVARTSKSRHAYRTRDIRNGLLGAEQGPWNPQSDSAASKLHQSTICRR